MKLIPLKPREVIYVLVRLGFEEKRQTGSHKIFYHREKSVIIPVPMHPREIKKGLLRSIISEAKITPQEFYAILRNK